MEKHNGTKLLLIRILHTILWAFLVLVIFFILYSGIIDRINLFTWLAICIIVVEGIVLVIHKWQFPLTQIAKKYTDDHVIGFDIFLPHWLAKQNNFYIAICYRCINYYL